MHRYLKSISALFVFSAALAFAVPANAQTHQKPPPTHEESDNGSFLIIDCKKNPLAVGCPPQQKYPKAASKEECSCELNRVNVGKRTLWVRNCYVQLPDRAIYYCKNPIHTPPKK